VSTRLHGATWQKTRHLYTCHHENLRSHHNVVPVSKNEMWQIFICVLTNSCFFLLVLCLGYVHHSPWYLVPWSQQNYLCFNRNITYSLFPAWTSNGTERFCTMNAIGLYHEQFQSKPQYKSLYPWHTFPYNPPVSGLVIHIGAFKDTFPSKLYMNFLFLPHEPHVWSVEDSFISLSLKIWVKNVNNKVLCYVVSCVRTFWAIVSWEIKLTATDMVCPCCN
jgi:hypothetical protein